MTTKVFSLELSQPYPAVDLAGHDKVLILFRWQGTPVGQAYLPVINGRFNHHELQATIHRLGWPLQQAILHHQLAWDDTHLPDHSLPLATVAVCTRDRPDDLQRCLHALLQLPDDGQEFLVIDNCPATDATRQIVEGYNGRIRYILEPRPGLDIARNRALREAHHPVVAFNDDDATPEPGWLRALLRNFKDPSILCATGLTMPLELETKAQEWFEKYSPFQRGFVRVVYDSHNLHPLAASKAGAGANMALRCSVLDLVGPFDEALDAGTPTHSGGDTEMFGRILAAGHRIVYDPTAVSWHRHRRTWEALRHTIYGYGVGVYATWTRNLLIDHELTVFLRAWGWLWHNQLPNLARALLHRPNSLPLDLVTAELKGCLAGPSAYIKAHRKNKEGSN